MPVTNQMSGSVKPDEEKHILVVLGVGRGGGCCYAAESPRPLVLFHQGMVRHRSHNDTDLFGPSIGVCARNLTAVNRASVNSQSAHQCPPARPLEVTEPHFLLGEETVKQSLEIINANPPEWVWFCWNDAEISFWVCVSLWIHTSIILYVLSPLLQNISVVYFSKQTVMLQISSIHCSYTFDTLKMK